MLMLSREYADKFPNFATEISDSGSAEAVFSKVYGKTLARMHVKVGTTSYTLLIRAPDKVPINNSAGAAVNMTCGPQDTSVSVEYTPNSDEKYHTTGDVQTIEFLR
jgi:hypothetical protein